MEILYVVMPIVNSSFIDLARIERKSVYIRFYSKEDNYYASASKLLYNITPSANTAKDARITFFVTVVIKIKLSHILCKKRVA